MKAVAFYEHGDLDKLKYVDLPEPEISADEVLVRVHACALNHLDIWARQGMPGVSLPLPHILGSDIAGEVVRVGSLAAGIEPGQRVLIAPGLCCGRCQYCLSGSDSLCQDYKIIGFQVNGGYAEYAKAPATNVIPISTTWSMEEWAAVPLVFLTAWHMLVTRAGLKPGETVLVQAAGSGIGSAAVQIAKYYNTRVIATAGSDEKLKKASELGVDETINYHKEDFVARVRKLTDNRGVDVVFEHLGSEGFEKSLLCLAKAGRLATCGATSGPTASLDLRYLFMLQASIVGSYMGGKKELLDVLKLMERKVFKPVVDKVFPLAEAAQAQRRMLERQQFGKLVLSCI